MDKIKLFDELISQANEIAYRNSKKDAVMKRADMLIRKFFGEKSAYVEKLGNISFSPSMFFSTTPQHVFEKHFNSGKKSLINLLEVILEDIQLDAAIEPAKETKKQTSGNATSKNIFVVHGHNNEMKESVGRVLDKLELVPIILHEQPNKGRTIIEKFSDYSDVAYAIVILSADDAAYNLKDDDKILKPRARQNVIFELGYFIGKLGRERVMALFEPVDELEIPSDYNGVLYVPFDANGSWKFELVKELNAAGIKVDANKII